MAMTMGPPLLPGFSLRVQLFSPHAHSSTDKPIRLFRVVTSPDVTVREFCQEASRIHEVNYGEPLAIKKVQDDEGFDITQSEIIGNLFSTTNIVRVVQALANRNDRDSVPPSSALRFEPTATRKRAREESARPEDNGGARSHKTNKRQRVGSPDPDVPLPSREIESQASGPSQANRIRLEEKTIPDSQGSMILGGQKVLNSRQVRQDLPMIPETPSPSPPPEVHALANKEQRADVYTPKPTDNAENEDSSFLSNADNSSPLRGTSIRAQSQPSNARAKSASYHIQRATERGASVSTAATSPMSLDQRNQVGNGTTSSIKRKRASPTLPKHNRTPFRSHNEDSLYENIASEDESSAFSRKKEALKLQNSARPIVPGSNPISNNINTPPNAFRRASASREGGNNLAELPLTPSSDKRRKQQLQEAEEARRNRAAAAEAAEQRKKEAEETRQAEELRVAEEARHQREEQERLEVEAFNRAETERKQKIENAARAEAERKEREKQEAEEAQQREKARVAKEEELEQQRRREASILRKKRMEEERIAREDKAKQEQLRREASIEKARIAKGKKAEEDRLAKEKAAAEAKRLQEERERIDREEREAVIAEVEEELSASQGSQEGKKVSSQSLPHSSPILPRSTPVPPPKPQASSTSFIPSGKKSNLKTSLSSQTIGSSSPSVPRSLSRDTSHGVSIEEQMPLPRKRNVSFDEATITPQRETRILPPGKRSTPNSSATPRPAVKPTSSQATPRPAVQKITPSQSISTPEETFTPVTARKSSSTGRQSNTPIPAPKAASRLSRGRSTTPIVQNKVPPPRKVTPTVATGKSSGASTPLKTYGRAATATKKGQSAPLEIPSTKEDLSEVESESASEQETANKSQVILPVSSSAIAPEIVSSNTTIKFEPLESRDEGENDTKKDKIDEDETQSHNTSPRNSRSPSRSPIILIQQPEEGPKDKLPSLSLASASGSDDEDMESESDSPNDERMPKSASRPSAVKMSPKNELVASDSDESSKSNRKQDEDDEGSDEDNEAEVQIPKSSPPTLPPHKQFVKPAPSKLVSKTSNNNSKRSSSVIHSSTQDEVDQQLTSSIYEALSAPSSSIPSKIPASSAAVRRSGFVGLSSLAAAKSNLAQSSAAKVNGARSSSQMLKLAQEEEEDDESEEESNDNSDDSSEEDVGLSRSNSLGLKTSMTNTKHSSQKDSDDSDSDSDSSDDDGQEQHLMAQISQLAKPNNSQGSGISSPKAFRTGTQDTGSAKKVDKKVSNSFLTGYHFNTPA